MRYFCRRVRMDKRMPGTDLALHPTDPGTRLPIPVWAVIVGMVAGFDKPHICARERRGMPPSDDQVQNLFRSPGVDCVAFDEVVSVGLSLITTVSPLVDREIATSISTSFWPIESRI